MKTCERCGGRGATMGHEINVLGWDQSVPQPCPCLTDRIKKLEEGIKILASSIVEYGEAGNIIGYTQLAERIAKALAALEDT